MATPKPGEIRCPTCHRSTPPAAFCTQCGSAIPPDARTRPRGMDRDELQDRIRARRSGGDPYRRGGPADDEVPGYERYEPEPEDQRGRTARAGEQGRRDHFAERVPAAAVPPPDRPEPRRDLTRDDDDDWAGAAAAPAAAATPAAAPTVEQPAHQDHFDDEAYADEPFYEYDTWEDDRERRGGGGALAILGFLALGVLALLGGAALAGVFGDDDDGIAQPTAIPTISASPVATETAAATSTPDATGGGESPGATATPPAGEPVVFPDGFIAESQPCLPGSAGANGCNSNAETNSGSLWVWVGFENGTENDVIGAELIAPDGTTVGRGSIDLADIGCRPACPGGWTYFPFSNLQPGEYEVQITRNGERADSMTFEVS